MDILPYNAVWWIAGLGALVVLFYLGIPLLIYANQKFESAPTVKRFDLATQKWPKPIEKLFRTARESLEQDGFEVLDSIKLPSAAPDITTVCVLFANPQTRDSAMATAMYVMPFDPSGLQTLYVEYTCRYRDGTVVNTNNSSQLSGLPSRPNVVSHWLPTVKDPHELFRIHQAASDEIKSRSQKVDRLRQEFDGDAVAYLQMAFRESFEDAAKVGWVFETGAYFRPTLKGAYLMTWRELFPWKMFRKLARDRDERATLAKFG